MTKPSSVQAFVGPEVEAGFVGEGAIGRAISREYWFQNAGAARYKNVPRLMIPAEPPISVPADTSIRRRSCIGETQIVCAELEYWEGIQNAGVVHMERETGFEPATSTLARLHSTS